jgi:hypothetical protein
MKLAWTALVLVLSFVGSHGYPPPAPCSRRSGEALGTGNREPEAAHFAAALARTDEIAPDSVAAGAASPALKAREARPSGPPQQDELKKMFPDIEAVKRSSRKLSKEGREVVEKAIERKLDDKEANPVIWEGRAIVPDANPSEKVRVLYTTVTAKGPKGEIRLGVAIAPDDHIVAGVRILENKDDPVLTSDAFLGQFDGLFRYTANLTNPASALDEARRSAAERKDTRAKQIDGLFKLMAIMHPVEGAWESLRKNLEKESKDAAVDADQVAKLFGEADKVLADFTFLRQSQVDSFRKRLKDSSRELGSVAQYARAGKMVEARATANEVEKMSCSQCHAGTQRTFREKRAELGIGTGYFVVGHDLHAPAEAKESFAAAAAAIRRAVLILNEAK